MYLKSIEIHGFKSFANKIIFEFHDGITGIVGPNGSGKSNVGDAVRWVLGEQSAKQLRGAKMEDIIFSGTETRKPMGYAYVAITLDNSDHKLPIDYEEVTVARRVYRSGESEYLINGSNCRLKDVQELFLDTGIGREGYSIIGQGQVDKILSGKPEERRELFDEAAGIVKFKKRKALAEKNLEAERQNLCRINDILKEIEKQIVPLEKQSEVAREYLKLRDELKTLDVNMFLMEYDRIYNSNKELDEKITIVSEDYKDTTNAYDNTKEEYDRLEQQIEKFNTSLEENKNLLGEYKINKEKLEGDIKVLQEQIIGARQNNTHYTDRMNFINLEMKNKNSEMEKYISEKNDIDKKLDDLDDNQTFVNEELNKINFNIDSFVKAIEECNGEIYGNLSRNSEIKTDLQRYKTMLEQNKIKKTELTQKLIKSKSNEDSYKSEIKDFESRLIQVSEQIKSLGATNSEIESEIQSVNEKINEYTDIINGKQQEFHREKSRLDSLKNITERYEGYGNSIRKIMEQKNVYPGIVGVVADIIKVKKEYETAVETALGGSIQNIVTDNEETAKGLISFLKTNKFGRATFLPLTSISNRNSFSNQEVLKEKGVIGIASSLIDTEKNFEGLVSYLLGKIIVVDNIDNAIVISKKYKYSLRIVTVDGELLNPGGSMSGGAYRNSSNLLSRRREIEDLEKKIEEITESIKNAEASASVEKENQFNLKLIIEENKNTVQELFLTQNTFKMNLDQAQAKKADSKAMIAEIQQENSEIELQTIELKKNVDKLNKVLENSQIKSREIEKKIEDFNNLLQKERELEKEITEKSASMRLDFSSLEQSNQYIVENIKRIKGDILRLEEEKEGLEKNIAESEQQVKIKQQQINETELRINGYNDNINNINLQIKELVEQKEEISKSHKTFFNKREELSVRINELDKENFRLNNQKEKLKEQSDAQVTYMWEEYELTYNLAVPLRNEEFASILQLKKLVSDLKFKIKALGDVNVNAIEDYKQLSERYELLRTQRDDLVKAEEVLIGIIEELDIEMRKQFEEKFAAIKKQFDIVFKELFGGGKGTLELIDNEDILEAGIRIIAQPPGKKLQNMMQLSGGEKALTAISLLFAIQNLKPSPFCLLDEIEAALDDSNVKRYAKYLHKLTKETQFIIITHRRGTMSAADVLYGITMQEKGVSTLVSVNLIEDELEK